MSDVPPANPGSVALPDCKAVLDLFAAYLATPLGQTELAAVSFERERTRLEYHGRLLEQARLWLQRGCFGFSRIEDPRGWLDRLSVPTSSLDALELLSLARYLEAAAALRLDLLAGTSDWPDLARLAAEIPDEAILLRRLQSSVLPNGELDDRASPLLAQLRRRREKQRQVIQDELQGELRRLSADGVVQEELVTLRNDRYVLPVRSELRRRAPGVVHGASSTGLTVYVEPLATIELNNEHIRTIEEEKAEAARILQELSALVAERRVAIGAGAVAVGKLELESAKAGFAVDYSAIVAEFTPEHEPALELRGARHPVLVFRLKSAVVPLDLEFDSSRLLVISGPNTGGKTVVLKTVGMAAWMAQCGLPVCASKARLPVFDSIAADIGDVQSLQENLSTFSSHLVHIRSVLETAGPQSLVLLDELGTATNAAEGAALAISIAEYLLQRRVWTLISTHHDALKAWAGTQPGVHNGSLAVDTETLQPNYRFRMGVPGVSAGLDMAARLGMPPALVAAARSRLSRGEAETAEFLKRLQASVVAAQEELEAVRKREAALHEREGILALHAAEDRRERRREWAKMRGEAERRFAKLAALLESDWRAVMESLKTEITDRAQRRKLDVAGARLRRQTDTAIEAEIKAIEATVQGIEPGPDPSANPGVVDPQPGDRVRVRSLQATALVRRRREGSIEVEAGHLRLQVPLSDIAAVLPSDFKKSSTGERRALSPTLTSNSAPSEVNLVGMRAEEARDRLIRFLDTAILGTSDEIRIVHGSGFGVLKRIVAEVLHDYPQVERFYQPPQNEGGSGVTVAVLKS